MAPRKRAKAKQGSGSAKKRQKKEQFENDQGEDHVVVTDYPVTEITTQNAANSPLLRLAAELRTRIWEYAYGESAVYVSAHFDKKAEPQWTLSYASCQEDHDLSGSQTCRNKACFKPFSVPTVSKQFWFEATATFLESSTFDFDNPEAFYEFASSGQACIPRIRRICLRDENSLYFFSRFWNSALNASVVGLFEGLRAVSLQLTMASDEFAIIERGDLMRSSRSDMRAFQKILRSLQQYRLDATSTAVSVSRRTYAYTMFGATDTDTDSNERSSAELIKKELLNYNPPRRSTRGREAGA